MILLQRLPGSFGGCEAYLPIAFTTGLYFNRFVLLDGLMMNVEDLRKIRESFLDISSATTLERLYALMAPQAAALMRSTAAAIYAFDEVSDVMRLVSQTGIENRYIGEELRRGEGAAGLLIERREPFTIQNS